MTTVYIGNTNVIELNGLKSAIENSYLNAATVVVSIKERVRNKLVSGQEWPTTMDYVTSSNGNYRAIMKDTVIMDPTKEYVAIITADAGTDRIGEWELRFKPVKRS